MRKNFSVRVNFDGCNVLAVILSQLKPGGRQYEVNINGFPRFYMAWSALGRYDVVDGQDFQLPGNLILAISDAIEAEEKN